MCCNDYVACIFAVIWSIVQTLFHLGWCIWGTFLYDCKYDLDNRTFKYFWYLTYFYTNSCVNATLDNLYSSSRFIVIWLDSEESLIVEKNQTVHSYIQDPQIVRSSNTTLKFPPQSAVADRTYNIFHAYIIIDSLWIIAAVALLIGTVCSIKKSLAVIFLFPWTVILLFILFFDGVAAMWYGIDISYTYGLTNWFLFIGGHNQTGLAELDPKFPKVATTIPSVLMMVLFSRFFVVWFVNLFLFFRIVQAAVNAVEDFDDEECFERKQFNQECFKNMKVVNNQRPRKFQVREINLNTASVRIRRWQLYYGTDDDEEESQVAQRYPRRSSKPRDQRHKNKDIKYDNKTGQNLAVIGGYEGDRSASPSPLPNDGTQIRYVYDNPCSSRYVSNDMYLSATDREGSSLSVYTEHAEINHYQNTRDHHVQKN